MNQLRLFPGSNLDDCIRKAIGGCIFQNVVEHPGKLVRISGQNQVLRHVHMYGFSTGRQNRIKFLCKLHQQKGQRNIFPGQRDAVQVKPGNFKKLIDELFQPVSLV